MTNTPINIPSFEEAARIEQFVNFSKNSYLVNNNALYNKHTEHISTTEPLWLDGMPGSDNIVHKREISSAEEPVEEDTHEYVDLDLPSGTLWATMNVGATSVVDFGNYYMYGRGSSIYDPNDSENYYGTENPLPEERDTATQEWGEEWHMPTKEQLDELRLNTFISDDTINGVAGYRFTSKSDPSKYIFIPAGGYYHSMQPGELLSVGVIGEIWSSTPKQSAYAWHMTLGHNYQSGSAQATVPYDGRKMGYNIRPVKEGDTPEPQTLIAISSPNIFGRVENNQAIMTTADGSNCCIWTDGKVSVLSGPGLNDALRDMIIQRCTDAGIQVTSVITETVQYEVGDNIENWNDYQIISYTT